MASLMNELKCSFIAVLKVHPKSENILHGGPAAAPLLDFYVYFSGLCF